MQYTANKSDMQIKESKEVIQRTIESIEKKIKLEIKNGLAQVKGSYLNDESNIEAKGLDSGGYGQEYMQSMLNRKVDNQDFNSILNTKTSKKDTQMMYE